MRQKIIEIEKEEIKVVEQSQVPSIAVYISLNSQQKIAKKHIKQSQRDLASMCSSQIYSDQNKNRKMTSNGLMEINKLNKDLLKDGINSVNNRKNRSKNGRNDSE